MPEIAAGVSLFIQINVNHHPMPENLAFFKGGRQCVAKPAAYGARSNGRYRQGAGVRGCDRACQEATEPDRRPLQFSVSEQHQPQRRTAQRHAGYPQRPAGHPNPYQPRLDRDHADRSTANLAALRSPRRIPCRSAPGRASFSAFLSPANPSNGWLWGIGPVIQVPTISDKTLGSNVWGGGPTAVLVLPEGAVGRRHTRKQHFLIRRYLRPRRHELHQLVERQPFVNYNFGGGWYVGSGRRSSRQAGIGT